jgi:lysophospholipase L1-like esterase
MKRFLSVAGVILAILRNWVLRAILPTVAVLVLSGDAIASGATPRIMPSGDSITRGWCGSAYRWGYRKPLYDTLTSGGYSFDFVGGRADGSFPDPNHEGHDGWRADEILNGRTSDPNAGKLANWLIAHQPDVVLLHIGTNDITQGYHDANVVNNILNVIDSYEAGNNKKVTVILALIINRRSDSPSTKRSQTTQFNNDVNAMALNRIANGDDIIIVDMESALNYDIGVDMADEVHPNDSGYAKMAVVWYNALVDYFGGPDFAIYGHVLEADGNTPVEGLLIQTDNNDINAVTDTNGFYELWVDYNWSGIVMPQNDGFLFEPNGYIYADVNRDYNDRNYTATHRTFKIAGFIFEQNSITPINDVNVSAENGGGPWTSRYGGGSTLTDANGYYEIVVDYNWSGKVTPRKYAYTFEPNSRYYEDVNQDYTAEQNYTGNKLDFKITGYISNECNVPIEGVLVSADNGGSEDMTDSGGFYEIWVDSGWSGTMTPAKTNYTFDPNWMSYVNVLADQPDQNYIAYNIYDLDCDGYIGLGDVAVITNNWFLTGPDIPGDLHKDGMIDFLDFAELCLVW